MLGITIPIAVLLLIVVAFVCAKKSKSKRSFKNDKYIDDTYDMDLNEVQVDMGERENNYHEPQIQLKVKHDSNEEDAII